jgi:exopolyphosphatase / guanosine-5'-triphosphate,3'-diphosphate pyrophosphatase
MARRAAVLDVGTNTVRLLVADCGDDGLTPVRDRTNMSRLGLGASADGTLAAESIARTAEAAIALVREARAAGAATILMIGTAAVRDAPNRDALLMWIERETGIVCHVVDGETEASLTFLGATVGRPLDGTLAVGDIGGGSTERIIAVDGAIRERVSIPIGSGRLTERTIAHDPPTDADLAAATRAAEEALRALRPVRATALLIAGGTASALGTLQGTAALDPAALDGALATLQSAPAAVLAPKVGLEVARVGLLAAGAIIVRALAYTCGMTAGTVAPGGIREGTLLAAMRGEHGFRMGKP